MQQVLPGKIPKQSIQFSCKRYFKELHCQFLNIYMTDNYSHLLEVRTNIFGTETGKGLIEENKCGPAGGTKDRKGLSVRSTTGLFARHFKLELLAPVKLVQ